MIGRWPRWLSTPAGVEKSLVLIYSYRFALSVLQSRDALSHPRFVVPCLRERQSRIVRYSTQPTVPISSSKIIICCWPTPNKDWCALQSIAPRPECRQVWIRDGYWTFERIQTRHGQACICYKNQRRNSCRHCKHEWTEQTHRAHTKQVSCVICQIYTNHV